MARNVGIEHPQGKAPPPSVHDARSTEEEIVGTLRAVDFEKDFLDGVIHGKSVHIIGLGDALDETPKCCAPP